MEQQESLEPRLQEPLLEIFRGVIIMKLYILTKTLESLIQDTGPTHCPLLKNG